MRSIINCGDRLMKDKHDYDARANFIWAASCGTNGITSIVMKGGCLGVHVLEHPMGAIDPKVAHGAGLGVAFPAFVRANAEKGLRLELYDKIAQEVFNKRGWEGLIQGWIETLKRWGHPTTLKELFGRDD